MMVQTNWNVGLELVQQQHFNATTQGVSTSHKYVVDMMIVVMVVMKKPCQDGCPPGRFQCPSKKCIPVITI